jgi:hypothetical protein
MEMSRSLVKKVMFSNDTSLLDYFQHETTPIDVDWGSNDTIEEFSVTMSYQWWESVEDGVV